MSTLEISPVETNVVDPHQKNIYDILQDNVQESEDVIVEESEYEADDEADKKKQLDKSIADLNKLVKIFFIPFVAGIIGRKLSGIIYRYFYK
ncbi:hypothetical protein FOG51_03320 [Hanseniaspora uvarum]|uniref:Uncharacterized protein n=1 Tax=Hanseniaspora uvarum TaxID=29833 RepID=A0A1E5RTV5_HANUV|nr:hypothetical protein FOG48_03401 [Hanseniaspora uvarum]KAF0271939.1 hypothetical protein FOG51_03320 [Hanseniaspora uvarum]KAF0278057.1 hypothetical protein FOG50_01092 [Hanseniaspora uvarum]OEJ90337.1 hypothetical protein AWRI3580_g1148 [Hanseniaspora uvarum]GMM41897.1 hypothetical protein DAHU10_028070 [Hanseniaspora uvarum]